MEIDCSKGYGMSFEGIILAEKLHRKGYKVIVINDVVKEGGEEKMGRKNFDVICKKCESKNVDAEVETEYPGERDETTSVFLECNDCGTREKFYA